MDTQNKTSQQWWQIIKETCLPIFLKKAKDYGTSWRILRMPSLTDQIFIKATRIRSIQDKGAQRVHDAIDGEFIGIINYCVMALIQLSLPADAPMELAPAEVEQLYMKLTSQTHDLLMNKNHDYGEAWRDMRITSFVDLILMKLLRVKQIEDHQGTTIASEGVDANYQDMINYSIFALIKMNEQQSN